MKTPNNVNATAENILTLINSNTPEDAAKIVGHVIATLGGGQHSEASYDAALTLVAGANRDNPTMAGLAVAEIITVSDDPAEAVKHAQDIIAYRNKAEDTRDQAAKV